MALEIRHGRDGGLRKHWYGAFIDSHGKRRVIALTETLPVKHYPGSLKATGNAIFEASRARAQTELENYQAEARRRGRVDHLVEKLIENKTGAKIEFTKLSELPEKWKSISRKRKPSKGWLANGENIIRRFSESVNCEFLHEVTTDQAAAHINALAEQFTPRTVNGSLKILRAAFGRFLPASRRNPFLDVSILDDPDTVHRRPFTASELAELFDRARLDPFMYPLIITAACTGLRRGDVCKLEWSSVDLKEGVLSVRTSKTGAAVNIPIFEPLRRVLETALTERENGTELVFPDAAAMLERNPDGLTWRFKKIASSVIHPESIENDAQSAETQPLADILDDVLGAVKHGLDGKRSDRVTDTLQRYAQGQSVRTIEKLTGRVRSQISGDLHLAENLSGFKFMPIPTSGNDVKRRINSATRITVKNRTRRASIVDWHSLRTTWVTLALSAGVPMELCRMITGHKTVEMVLKHYFRPGQEHLKDVLSGLLPDVLTGGEKKPLPAAKPDISELAKQLSELSQSDRAQLQKLLTGGEKCKKYG